MARSPKRLIIAGLLGLFLACLLIWVIQHVYDPFSDEVDDLAVLLPENIDFFIEVKDFPSFVRGLENREFYSRLDRNRDFQAFLSSSLVRDTEFIPLLQDAMSEISRAHANPDIPFGLEVLGDLSGTQVVVGGYLPEKEGDDIRLMVCFKPESALGIVAVNAILDETLYGWFVQDNLADVVVVHRNWGAELTVTKDGVKSLWALARIENAIVIGNDPQLIKRSVNRINRDGILLSRPSRLTGRWVFEGDGGASIQATLTQKTSGQKVGLIDQFLAPMWGEENARAFEAIFPRFEGEDLRINVEIDEVFATRLSIETEPRDHRAPFEKMKSLDLERVNTQLDEVLAKLPYYVFGYGYLSSRPSDLLTHVFNQPDLMDADKRALWFEQLAENLPRFSSAIKGADGVPDVLPLLEKELTTAFGEGVGFALFKKQRDDGFENEAPGLALILDVTDRQLIEDLLNAADTMAGEGSKPLEREELDGNVFWRIANTSFLDDADNNQPGFALIGNHFVVTNWFRLLEDFQVVPRREVACFGAVDRIRDGLDRSEPWTRGFFFLDASTLYEYMDDAKAGWVREKMKVADEDTFAQVTKLEEEADRRQLSPARRDTWISQKIEAWVRDQLQGRNEQAIKHEIDRYLNYFRAAFDSLFISIGQVEEELRVDLRLQAAEH